MSKVNPNVAIVVMTILILGIVATLSILLLNGMSFDRISPFLTIVTLLVSPAISAMIAFLFGAQAVSTATNVANNLQNHVDKEGTP